MIGVEGGTGDLVAEKKEVQAVGLGIPNCLNPIVGNTFGVVSECLCLHQ